MSNLSDLAIETSLHCTMAFAKFLSPNETGLTGGHQCGIYIPKQSARIIFDAPFRRGENHERNATIIWNGGQWESESHFIYYGKRTRDEYRITKFGQHFPFLTFDHTGDLFVLCKIEENTYRAFVLSSDEDIQNFLEELSLSITDLNRIVVEHPSCSLSEEELFETYYVKFEEDFPSTELMAISAEEAESIIGGDRLSLTPDDKLIRWVDTEYRLFRYIEQRHYEYVTLEPAKSLDAFVKTSLEIINRRKSRAGKSLEHHLTAIFEEHHIENSYQPTTELGKQPDFIFPSEEAYGDPSFPTEKLTFLASKTTCKDRWRQILDEADRIKTKHLFTLQPGISPNQLRQMREAGIVLVVPKAYHDMYPKIDDGAEIISLETFIEHVLHQQGKQYHNPNEEKAPGVSRIASDLEV